MNTIKKTLVVVDYNIDINFYGSVDIDINDTFGSSKQLFVFKNNEEEEIIIKYSPYGKIYECECESIHYDNLKNKVSNCIDKGFDYLEINNREYSLRELDCGNYMGFPYMGFKQRDINEICDFIREIINNNNDQ